MWGQGYELFKTPNIYFFTLITGQETLIIVKDGYFHFLFSNLLMHPGL